MIIPDKKSGYGANYGRIEYISLWHKDVWHKEGQMRFYGGNLANVTDFYVSVDGQNLYAVIYPHCDTPEFMKMATEKEEEIRALIKQAKEKYLNPYHVTIDVSGPFLVENEHFSKFTPVFATPKNELFFFDSIYELDDYPRLFMFEEKQRTGLYRDVLPVLALSSGVVMPDYGTATMEGKQFTFNILHAWLSGKFEGDCPEIYSVDFPSNERDGLPKSLNTSILDKILESSGVYNLTMKDGKLVEKDDAGEISNEAVKAIEEDMFGKPNTTKLAAEIERQIFEKCSVNLSDAFQFGFAELLSLVPYSSTPIEIHLDVANIARKMCMFEGLFHVILSKKNDAGISEFLYWIDEPESMFRFVTDDSFPRKALPPALP